MKISFERTGGFAGLMLAVRLELNSLPAEDAAALQKLVEDSDFFHLPEPDAQQGFPDGYRYTIMVEREAEQRTVEFSEGALPEQLRALVNDLSIRARSQGR